MVTSFLNDNELKSIGFKSIGDNVLISRFARFYNPQNIEIGNNVRIDDFCILSGNISIGNNVHISAYVALYGFAGIEIQDYAGISAKSIIYSEIDDFSGETLVGPWHSKSKRKTLSKKVVLEKFSQIGCGCTVFPGVNIKEGTAVGAMSLVKKNLEPWSIYAGIPCRKIGERSPKMLSLL